jgi:hypothetical protein
VKKLAKTPNLVGGSGGATTAATHTCRIHHKYSRGDPPKAKTPKKTPEKLKFVLEKLGLSNTNCAQPWITASFADPILLFSLQQS